MKYKKIFSTLALAMVFALLVGVIPAAPAVAAESIDIDPQEGEIGDYIDVDGDDFERTTWVSDVPTYSIVEIYFSSDEADTGDEIDNEVTIYEMVKSIQVDEWGSFSTSFRVPTRMTDGDDDVNVTGGTYFIYFTYEDDENIEEVTEFTVIAGEIEVYPTSGLVGVELEISGTNFSDSELLYVYYDDDLLDITDGDTETDSNGDFTSYVIVPNSAAGTHTVLVEDDAGSSAEAEFSVKPKMSINPTSGTAGERVAVRGQGFGEDEVVIISFDGTRVTQGQVDALGVFTAVFEVPGVGAGTHTIEAEDESGNSITADFTMAIDYVVSPTEGNVGTRIVASGSGFVVNRQITVTFDNKQVATATTDNKGVFTANFAAPEVEGGKAYAVTASDGTNSKSVNFTMESTPPAIPQPLLPAMGVKVEAPTRFDWADVTDSSPLVTYTLEIASAGDFSQGSIVLEKTGLTRSEYTLTETEQAQLEPTKEGFPYYWRMRAVDGASNVSGWTGLGEFNVGRQFGLEGWPTYVLMVVGGIVLLLAGFLIGRKTSYYT